MHPTDLHLDLAVVMSIVTGLLTARLIRDRRRWPPLPPGTYRLGVEFIIGLWLLSAAFWMTLEPQFAIHASGRILGLVGCIILLWGVFRMNRDFVQPGVKLNNAGKPVKISEIKQKKKPLT